jgi:hypothetical protein
MGRGAPSELAVWKAASTQESGRAEEFIELDPEDAIEVDLETGASCADAKASTSTELAGSNFS